MCVFRSLTSEYNFVSRFQYLQLVALHIIFFHDKHSHCPWVGNCIGARNHKPFFIFLVLISSITTLITITCFRIIKETFDDLKEEDIAAMASHPMQHGPEEEPSIDGLSLLFYTISHLPIVFFMSVFTLLCTWSLTSLTFFHALIISVAQTTNERVRNVYKGGGSESGLANPADMGFVMNWTNAFCTVCPESRLPEDFSEEVDCLEGRRMRDLVIMEKGQETFVDAEEHHEDDCDEEDYHEDEKNDIEGVYDSQRAARAVESSVVNGIVYSE